MIKKGSKVSIEYTLYLEDGTVEDSNVGGEPLVYEHGAKMIVSGLEYRLEGLKAGDTRKITLKPEEAYGKTNPNMFQIVPKDKFPPESLKVGSILQAKGQDGRPVSFVVHEVHEDTVVVDLNHPLAGKTLTFDVKVLDVQ